MAGLGPACMRLVVDCHLWLGSGPLASTLPAALELARALPLTLTIASRAATVSNVTKVTVAVNVQDASVFPAFDFVLSVTMILKANLYLQKVREEAGNSLTHSLKNYFYHAHISMCCAIRTKHRISAAVGVSEADFIVICRS